MERLGRAPLGSLLVPELTLPEAGLGLLAADRDYLWRIGAACIRRPNASVMPLLCTFQHLALINYEGRRYLERVDPEQARSLAPLDDDAVVASRHANKLFMDTNGYLQGVVENYASIVDGHHRVFFPENRGAFNRLFDGLRDDLGVFRFRGQLVATTHTMYFNSGLPREAFGPLDVMGPRMGEIAQGLAGFAKAGPPPEPGSLGCWLDAVGEDDFEPIDVKSWRFYKTAFSGQIDPDLAAALIFVLSACSTVDLLTAETERLADGTWPVPVLKLRYVTLYQVLDSLNHLMLTRGTALPEPLLDRPGAALVLSRPGRNLRNTLVHYGVRIPGVSALPAERPLFGIVEHVMDGMTYEQLCTLVDRLLRDCRELLQTWSGI